MLPNTKIRVTKLVHFNGQFAQFIDTAEGLMYEVRRHRNGGWYTTGNYTYL